MPTYLLTENPIIKMEGAHFLWLYGICILLGYILLKKYDNYGGKTHIPLSFDRNIDLYRYAWLRGGEDEFVKYAIFSAITRKVISKEYEDYLMNGTHLSGIDAVLFNGMKPTINGFNIIDLKKIVKKNARTMFKEYGLWLKTESLCSDSIQNMSLIKNTVLVNGLIIIFGLWKIITAIGNGHHNFVYLSAMVLAVVIGSICRITRISTERLSLRGKEYIQRVSETHTAITRQCQKAEANEYEPALMAASIFGVAVLTGTAFAAYATEVTPKKDVGSSGGCGGGTVGGCSGSSGGCSSGCGGGCGGCS